jgi:hypothetical protein
MNAQQEPVVTSIFRVPTSSRWGRRLTRNFCVAAIVVVALWPAGPAAGFNSFVSVTTLQNSAGTTIVTDRDEGSDVTNPLPPNTAFTAFIGGGSFQADAYVDTNAVIAVAAGMSNRLDRLTSRASFSLDIENSSSRPRRMDLGFLIFPGELRLIARNAEASFDITVTVVGGDIEGPNGFPPRFDAGGTLRTDAAGLPSSGRTRRALFSTICRSRSMPRPLPWGAGFSRSPMRT